MSQRRILFQSNCPTVVVRGDTNQVSGDFAFEWLEKSYQQRSGALTNILGDPLLKSLHDDPRYLDLVNRMNFPPN